MHAFNAFGIPWFALFYRAEKHFIHAESIGAVFVNQIIWINSVEF